MSIGVPILLVGSVTLSTISQYTRDFFDGADETMVLEARRSKWN